MNNIATALGYSVQSSSQSKIDRDKNVISENINEYGIQHEITSLDPVFASCRPVAASNFKKNITNMCYVYSKYCARCQMLHI